MRDLIIEAINSKKMLSFLYNQSERTVEPHTFGIFSSTNNLLLVAYQIEGGSSSGQIPGWRNFDLANILNLELINRRFSRPRDGYNPNDSRFDSILAKI